MDPDDECDYWDALFSEQRDLAFEYLRKHNAELPTDACPMCGKLRHVPGFPCPKCGYRHLVALGRVRDTEHGYEVIGVGAGTAIFARFIVVEEE